MSKIEEIIIKNSLAGIACSLFPSLLPFFFFKINRLKKSGLSKVGICIQVGGEGLSGLGCQSLNGARRESMMGRMVAACVVVESSREVRRFSAQDDDDSRDLAQEFGP